MTCFEKINGSTVKERGVRMMRIKREESFGFDGEKVVVLSLFIYAFVNN